MAIYVDAIIRYPQQARAGGERFFGNGKPSCHMVCDGDLEELHAMAQRIGLKRTWFQHDHGNAPWLWHYDLTPSKRLLAVKAGAIEVKSISEIIQKPRLP